HARAKWPGKDAAKQEGRRRLCSAPPFGVEGGLEVEAQAKLHATRSVSAGCVQEAGAVGIGARIVGVHLMTDRIGPVAVLCVVKEIEDFPPELKTGVLANGEALEGTDVEIDSAGQEQRVTPDSAEREAGGQSKRRRIVEQRPAGVRKLGFRQAGMRI